MTEIKNRSRMTRATRSVVLLLCLAAAPRAVPAAAGDQPHVVLAVDVKEEISLPDEKGNLRVVRRPVERAEPGDILVYTLTYTNEGNRPSTGTSVEDPIPAGTILLPGSVLGDRARITFSMDGGVSFTPFPATIVTNGPDGRPVSADAPAERYTHIRWMAMDPLAPGESRIASFKVVVR